MDEMSDLGTEANLPKMQYYSITPFALENNVIMGFVIEQGREQLVKIPEKAMLSSMMQALGATNEPLYSFVKCGDLGFKATVKLDVSCLGNGLQEKSLESEVCQSEDEALSGCISKAFRYISSSNAVKICDYTSKLVENIEEKSALNNLIDALYAVQKMVERWGQSFRKSEVLAMQLQSKINYEGHADTNSPSGLIYHSLNRALENIMKRFRGTLNNAELKLKQCQDADEEATERRTKEYHEYIRRVSTEIIRLYADN